MANNNKLDLDDLLKNEQIKKFLKENFIDTSTIDSDTTPSSTPLKVPNNVELFKKFINNNQNIWILSVVSVPFKVKTPALLKRSKYLRSFVLYNLATGEAIPYLMKKSPKTGRNQYSTLLKNKSETDQNKIKIINTYKYYYNISNDIIGAVFKGKKYSNVVKDQANYIKRKIITNII